MSRHLLLILITLAVAASTTPAQARHTLLGVQGTRFTLNGVPTFLLGISYFGGLGAPEELVRKDLLDMHRLGFNWIRVWVTWTADDHDFSALYDNGRPRQPYFRKLQWLVAECDRRGLVVDITLARGAGPEKAPHLATIESLRQAIRTLVPALRPHWNWYLDLANERNVGDRRFVGFEDLRALREVVRQLDPSRLVTASHGGDLSQEDLRQYLGTARVDFICPHRPRDAASPTQTLSKTREYLGWMDQIGHPVPIHYQEPFRRGYGDWQPLCADYLADARGAIQGGAAGWCLHNGGQAGSAGGKPWRSFDLSQFRLFDQLDSEERCAADQLSSSIHPSLH